MAVLRRLLAGVGRTETSIKPPAPRLGSFPPAAGDAVMDLYRCIGGIQNCPSLRPGSWDLAFEDGLVIELDEDLHFHRYRGVTLDAPWAEDLPGPTHTGATSRRVSIEPVPAAAGGPARQPSECSVLPTQTASLAIMLRRGGNSQPCMTP